MEHYTMNLTLKVWRQKSSSEKGSFETHKVSDISSEMSFLEMIDVLNERLITEGKDPIAFDHDCREGICGMCSMYINGRPHGPWTANTTCQLHMRAYKDGDTIVVEPWRANAFPVIKDLATNRSSFITHPVPCMRLTTPNPKTDKNTWASMHKVGMRYANSDLPNKNNSALFRRIRISRSITRAWKTGMH